MSDTRKRDDGEDRDIDLDVDIDQELKLKLEQETDIEVETESKTKSEYEVEVRAPERSHVDVKIDIEEDKEIKEEHEIELKEYVRKDIDIDIDENVSKEIDISLWETKVNVEAKNIIDGSDNDVNDFDSQKLIDVGQEGVLKMDDFAARNLAIGKSFNGQGNDAQYSVTQSNSLTDNDKLIAPSVVFLGLDGRDKDGSNDLWDQHRDGKDDDSPFQKVEAKGGEASAGDGIEGNSHADWNGTDGSVLGESLASANGVANVSAFTQNIVTGANQQGNFASLDVVGGNLLQANDINGQPAVNAATDGGHHDPKGEDEKEDKGDRHDDGLAVRDSDDDVNDLDAQSLISVGYDAELYMDNFRLDTVAIGDSFNGPGNDMQFDFVQVNDLVDNDEVIHPEVKFVGSGGSPFQDVEVHGGAAYAGDGIQGNSSASNNGLSGSVAGKTAASADAVANVEAFTQNIVMGANLQVNNWTASVVGGDATIADNIGDFTA
jgi:hypothetical protein